MKVKIITCDLCGEIQLSTNNYNWTNVTQHLTLGFSEHSSVQANCFDGDICACCAKKLMETIDEKIKELKTIKETK